MFPFVDKGPQEYDPVRFQKAKYPSNMHIATVLHCQNWLKFWGVNIRPRCHYVNICTKQLPFHRRHFETDILCLLTEISLIFFFRCPIDFRSALAHYCDVIIGAMASQITSLTIVYSIVHAGADESKHQSSASLAFVRGIHRPVNSPQKGPVTRKMFPVDDVIMRNNPSPELD